MALSNKQRASIVFYLGWSGLTLTQNSTQYNSVVDDRITSAAADAEISRIAKDLLDCLAGVDAQLKEAQCRASTKSVDNITLNNEEIRLLKKERNRYIRELADHLDIPITKRSSQSSTVIV